MAVSICDICGEEKDEEFFYDRPNGLSHYCIECEQHMYDRMSEHNGVGAYIGLFATCAALNVPFWPDKLPKVQEFLCIEDRWVWYNEAIADEVHGDNGLVRGFFDGETNILRIFGTGLSKTDVAKFIEVTQAHEAERPGTREQRERWGSEPLCKGLNPSEALYNELDRQYENWCGRYRGQAITPQLADSIIKVCRWNAITDFLMREGEYLAAQKVQKMCDDLMASEQMRKKDEKPIEGMRMDALVIALERDGAMENGQFKTQSEVMEAFWKRYFKNKKYNYSIDAADHMIFDYYNNARINADLPAVSELPADLRLEDPLGEFEKEPTEEEIKRARYAGLTPVVFENDATSQGGS